MEQFTLAKAADEKASACIYIGDPPTAKSNLTLAAILNKLHTLSHASIHFILYFLSVATMLKNTAFVILPSSWKSYNDVSTAFFSGDTAVFVVPGAMSPCLYNKSCGSETKGVFEQHGLLKGADGTSDAVLGRCGRRIG
jgi:hypothetical protein